MAALTPRVVSNSAIVDRRPIRSAINGTRTHPRMVPAASTHDPMATMPWPGGKKYAARTYYDNPAPISRIVRR